MHRDPVCGKRINPNKAYVQIEYRNEMYYLCCPLCQSEFEKEPDKYMNKNPRGRKRRRAKS